MKKATDIQIQQLKKAITDICTLSSDCWVEIEPLVYVKELKKNDYFSKEGQLVNDFGFVANGILRNYLIDDKGDEWNRCFLQKNNIFTSSIPPEKPAITCIQALTKTTVLCISYRNISNLTVKYNELNSLIQKLSFAYLEQKQNREICLLTEEATQNYLTFQKTYPNLENQIPHYHIASYLGITPTQLSRLRKKLNMHQHM